MDLNLPKLFAGSVKTIYGHEDVAPYVFEYSDRYSIFDWGAMPNHIHQKGEALTFFAEFFFKFLEDRNNWAHWSGVNYPLALSTEKLLAQLKATGVQHHGIGRVTKNRYAVNPVKILHPKAQAIGWDYTDYQSTPLETLVPLEVVFRFGCPAGSSLPQRLAADEKYCRELGIEDIPKTNEIFKKPIIEFSTKLEQTDRYISYSEARQLAALTEQEFAKLKDLTELIAHRLKDLFAQVGVQLWDGKFEFAFAASATAGERDFLLVDSIGPDELRLTYRGISLSKENVRQLYQGSEWEKNVKKAKELAHARGAKNWKEICIQELGSTPEQLAENDIERLSMIYLSLANALAEKFTGKKYFTEAWSLETLWQKWS